MTPAAWPRPDPLAERLVVLSGGRVRHATIAELPLALSPGDVAVVNDAATLPASLAGELDGEEVELRIATPLRGREALGVLFGEGDHRTRTEDRPPPPRVGEGALIRLGAALNARVVALDPRSPRLVRVRFGLAPGHGGAPSAPASDAQVLSAIYRQGRHVQYAHVVEPLRPWHAQTPFGGAPWAVELPSAGRPLGARTLAALARRGVRVTSLTHAAGLSATGDPTLDARLPLEERYLVPERTISAIAAARASGGRVIAIGTSVTRALEGLFASRGELVSGEGETDLRLDASHALRVVDGILTGLHDEGTSHHALLGAFAPEQDLARALGEARERGCLGHEFGDSLLILRPR